MKYFLLFFSLSCFANRTVISNFCSADQEELGDGASGTKQYALEEESKKLLSLISTFADQKKSKDCKTLSDSILQSDWRTLRLKQIENQKKEKTESLKDLKKKENAFYATQCKRIETLLKQEKSIDNTGVLDCALGSSDVSINHNLEVIMKAFTKELVKKDTPEKKQFFAALQTCWADEKKKLPTLKSKLITIPIPDPDIEEENQDRVDLENKIALQKDIIETLDFLHTVHNPDTAAKNEYSFGKSLFFNIHQDERKFFPSYPTSIARTPKNLRTDAQNKVLEFIATSALLKTLIDIHDAFETEAIEFSQQYISLSAQISQADDNAEKEKAIPLFYSEPAAGFVFIPRLEMKSGHCEVTSVELYTGKNLNQNTNRVKPFIPKPNEAENRTRNQIFILASQFLDKPILNPDAIFYCKSSSSEDMEESKKENVTH